MPVHLDSECAQELLVPDPRMHEDGWRTKAAGAQNSFDSSAYSMHTARVLQLHSYGSSFFDHNASDKAIRQHGQIAAMPHRPQKRGRHRLAQAAPNGGLTRTEPIHRRCVEILTRGEVERASCLQESIHERIVRLDARHVHRSSGAVKSRRRPCLIAFRPEEIRKQIRVSPSLSARTLPLCVIARMAPDVDHAVDGTRSPQHLT